MFLKQVIRITLWACCLAVCSPHSTAYELSDFAPTNNKSVITNDGDFFRIACIESARFGVERAKGSGKCVWASNVKWSTSFDVITSELARCVFEKKVSSRSREGIHYGPIEPPVLLFNEKNGFKPLREYTAANYNFLLFVNFLKFAVEDKVSANPSGVDSAADLFLANIEKLGRRNYRLLGMGDYSLYAEGIKRAVSDVRKYVNVVSETLNEFVNYIRRMQRIRDSLECSIKELPFVKDVSIVRSERRYVTSFSGSYFRICDNRFTVGEKGNVSTSNDHCLGSTLDATVCGLKNIGSTCYFNAAIQFLYSFPEFVRFLDSSSTIQNKNSLSSALFSLFRHIEDQKSKYRGVAADPTNEFLDIAVHVKSLPMANGKKSSNVQLDASELVEAIIAKLKEEAKSTKNASLINLFSENFESQIKIETKCWRKHDISTRVDPFSIIRLPIVCGGSLNACLSQYFSLEKINDPKNLISCEKCKNKVEGTRKHTIVTSPEILMISFNRFSCNKSTKTIKKLSDAVGCPSILRYNGKLYRLVSLISHKSDSADRGHYIAKRLVTTHGSYGDYTNSQRSAWLMNDEIIKEAPMAAETAYVVGYRCID